MGGLSAALRLRQRGHEVTVFEARSTLGGLAGFTEAAGMRFETGPYVLLDPPGLRWAFEQLQLSLEPLALQEIDHLYSVNLPGHRLQIFSDLERTAAGFERQWPGSALKYRAFVDRMRGIYEQTRPMQTTRPGVASALRTGAWRALPFLLRSLRGVMASSGLSEPICQALNIWTHIAGQTPDAAPSPLALVPGIIHTHPPLRPKAGVGAVPEALHQAGLAAGVRYRTDTPVTSILVDKGRAVGIQCGEERIEAAAVVSDVGLATYARLLQPPPASAGSFLRLPLQGPGVQAYLRVAGVQEGAFLRFRLKAGADPDPARLLVLPDALGLHTGGARLICPLSHDRAAQMDLDDQTRWLESRLAEDWWQEHLEAPEVVYRRVPRSWGQQFGLHDDSMNPVMTAAFMRQGRVPHGDRHIDRLVLCGASTHPGQWVSFCAISGILAADRLEELGRP